MGRSVDLIPKVKLRELEEYLIRVAEHHILGEGSNLHLSVDLVAFGRALNLTRGELKELSEQILYFFRDRIGQSGSVLISSFSFDFPQFGVYSPSESPIVTGNFAEQVFELFPDSRTLGPIYSFLAFGAAFESFSGPSASSTGLGSVFEQMERAEFSLVTVGHHLASAFTVAHCYEEMVGVEYREIKNFSGLIATEGLERPWNTTMYVRKNNCIFSGLTSEGFSSLVRENIASVRVDGLSGQPVASYSVKLGPAGLVIRSNLFMGRRDYIAPIRDDASLTHGVTPLDRLQAMHAYLEDIRRH